MRFILDWEPTGHGDGARGGGRSREREESKETSRSIHEKPGAASSLVSGVRAPRSTWWQESLVPSQVGAQRPWVCQHLPLLQGRCGPRRTGLFSRPGSLPAEG